MRVKLTGGSRLNHVIFVARLVFGRQFVLRSYSFSPKARTLLVLLFFHKFLLNGGGSSLL